MIVLIQYLQRQTFEFEIIDDNFEKSNIPKKAPNLKNISWIFQS